MNAHVRAALVDRHGLAAAIQCGADLIITFNLGEFPDHALASYGLGACHPDPCLVDQLNLDAEQVCTAMRQQRASLKNPPKPVEEYLEILEEQGLSRFSQAVRHYAAEI